jgi:hypothetical protein
MIDILITQALSPKPPTLAVVLWIRGRVYQALSFCQTGPEIIDSCAAALQRNYVRLEPRVFWEAMRALTHAEPHTSYRTPLSLEAGLLALFEEIRKSSNKSPCITSSDGIDSSVTVAPRGGCGADVIPAVAPRTTAPAAPAATAATKPARTTARKKPAVSNTVKLG